MKLFNTYFIQFGQTLPVAGLKLLVASDQYVEAAQPHLDYFQNTFSDVVWIACLVGLECREYWLRVELQSWDWEYRCPVTKIECRVVAVEKLTIKSMWWMSHRRVGTGVNTLGM